MNESFDRALRDAGVLGILRTQAPLDEVLDLVEAAVAAGLTLLEFPLTNRAAEEQIATAAERFPGLHVGAGTVLTVADVARVRAAGASFVVTPSLDADVARATLAVDGLGYLPGVLTPRDIADALRLGVATLKLFPAGVFGPRYLRALRAPFPGVGFVPTGAISPDDVEAYREAGAVAVAVGGELFAGADPAVVGDRVRGMLRAVAARS